MTGRQADTWRRTRTRGRANARLALAATGWLFAVSVSILKAAPADFIVNSAPAFRIHELDLLRFARDLQRELCDGLGLPPARDWAPVEFELGLTEDTSRPIDHAVLRKGRRHFGLVRIPDPITPDADDLRFALTAAIVRTALYNRAPQGATVTEPPVWFVRGLARYGDRRRNGSDFEAAYTLWSCARLPGAGELWQAERSPGETFPAVAAQLVAWCGTGAERQARWGAWFDHLARGGAWSPDKVAEIWIGRADLAALDADWDDWMIARTRRVFDIGTTPAGVVRRFRALLLLYPWECAIYNPAIVQGGTPLAWCVENPDSPGLRQAAKAKALQMVMHGAGRDPAFRELMTAYAAVLNRMAAGASATELSGEWRRAEAMRSAIEAAGADGTNLSGRTDEAMKDAAAQERQ